MNFQYQLKNQPWSSVRKKKNGPMKMLAESPYIKRHYLQTLHARHIYEHFRQNKASWFTVDKNLKYTDCRKIIIIVYYLTLNRYFPSKFSVVFKETFTRTWQGNTCSKSIIGTLEKYALNVFKGNNKDTRATSTTSLVND